MSAGAAVGAWPVEVPTDVPAGRREAVAGVLAAEVGRDAELPVDVSAIVRWCEAHHEGHRRHWPGPGRDVVAPPVMLTAFTRPLEWHPARRGEPPSRGVALHDRLKEALGLPTGIGRGYELELRSPVVPGDRLRVAERVVALGEERPTRLGPGRDWAIEVTTARADGAVVGVERWSLVGYRPGVATPGGGDAAHPPAEPPASDRPVLWTEELDVDATLVVMGAAANRVWAPQHHDHRAAVASGAPDIFLDTSTQLGLWASLATAHADGREVRRATLRMRRPVCPGDRVLVTAIASPSSPGDADADALVVDVVATVSGEVVSESRITLDHRQQEHPRGP